MTDITTVFGAVCGAKCQPDKKTVVEKKDVLKLDDIDINHPEGLKLRAAAELILKNLGSEDKEQIRLDQVRNVQGIITSAANNGDGVITPELAKDPETAEFINTVITAVGSQTDAGGKEGITEAKLQQFLSEAQKCLQWQAQAVMPDRSENKDILPWSKDTAEAYQLIQVLDEKIEQYFAQCAIVGFDKKTAAYMGLRDKELEDINFRDKSVIEEKLKDAPLGLFDPDCVLHLDNTVNPFYKDKLNELQSKVLKRSMDRNFKKISLKEWRRIKDIFAGYKIWLEGRPSSNIEKISPDKLKNYLEDSHTEKIKKLIEEDKAVADKLNQIQNLEKIILYQRWLLELVNNFVSFPKLYNPDELALFEMGTLIIDGRHMSFTVKVKDRASHIKVAKESHMYLLYVEVSSQQDKTDKFEVATAVTSGDAAGLRKGKRGIFFTTDGKEWDAEIIDIIANPVSLWESIKAPFQQLGGFIGKQIEKFNASGYAKLEKSVGKGLDGAGKSMQGQAGTKSSGASRDLLLSGGIAVAALGSAFAYITSTLSKVRPMQWLMVLLGLAALILLPGMIIGLIKLRRRDMSVILEASGWAINLRMRLTGALGRIFTRTPSLPKGSSKKKKDLVFQFARRFGYQSISWKRIISAVLIVIVLIVIIFLIVNTYFEKVM